METPSEPFDDTRNGSLLEASVPYRLILYGYLTPSNRTISSSGLHIERMCLTGGATPVPHYLEAYNVSLFLTSYPSEVEKALEHGMTTSYSETFRHILNLNYSDPILSVPNEK